MPYYRGDYYRGRGRGDLFGSILKGVGGFITGGPLGAVSALLPQGPARATPTPPKITLQGSGRDEFGNPRVPPPVYTGSQGGPGMSGYHQAKDGSGRWVRNRSMNPGNAKALRRAIRRQGSFVALAKRALSGSGYTFKRTGAPKSRGRGKGR